MLKKLLVILALLLCPIMTLAADTNPVVVSPYVKIFGDNETIYYSVGGDENDFLAAADEVLATGRYIRIAGPCLSACGDFAARARPNVCITNGASFGFHMSLADWKNVDASWIIVGQERPPRILSLPEFQVGTEQSETGAVQVYQEVPILLRVPMILPDDIYAWVLENGGFTYGYLRLMDSKEASAFWPMCK